MPSSAAQRFAAARMRRRRASALRRLVSRAILSRSASVIAPVFALPASRHVSSFLMLRPMPAARGRRSAVNYTIGAAIRSVVFAAHAAGEVVLRP